MCPVAVTPSANQVSALVRNQETFLGFRGDSMMSPPDLVGAKPCGGSMNVFWPVSRLVRLGTWLLVLGFAIGLVLGVQVGSDELVGDPRGAVALDVVAGAAPV